MGQNQSNKPNYHLSKHPIVILADCYIKSLSDIIPFSDLYVEERAYHHIIDKVIKKNASHMQIYSLLEQFLPMFKYIKANDIEAYIKHIFQDKTTILLSYEYPFDQILWYKTYLLIIKSSKLAIPNYQQYLYIQYKALYMSDVLKSNIPILSTYIINLYNLKAIIKQIYQNSSFLLHKKLS